MSDPVWVALISAIALVLTSGAATIVVALINRRNDKRARPMEATVQQIVDQVTNNSGTSLKDAVDRTEEIVAHIRDVQENHGVRVAVLEGRLEDHMRQELARWQAYKWK